MGPFANHPLKQVVDQYGMFGHRVEARDLAAVPACERESVREVGDLDRARVRRKEIDLTTPDCLDERRARPADAAHRRREL